MARADLLLKLIRAGALGDQTNFRRLAENVIAEERAKNHHVLADQLAEQLNQTPPLRQNGFSDSRAKGLFWETTPKRDLNSLILPEGIRQACDELIEEQLRRELLHSYNLEPRNRILLTGPPGNGKTSLAECVAHSLAIPLLTIRYESLIGSFLGETASRLKQAIDLARTAHCVLFFDEFDTIGKERGDEHETGEIKRVVSSLLLQIDALPSYVIVIAASNHHELLDRAVWRRFQLRMNLPRPTRRQIEAWLARFQESVFKQPLGYAPKTISEKLTGISFAEVEEFCLDVQRRFVLTNCQGDIKSIVSARIEQWKNRLALDTS